MFTEESEVLSLGHAITNYLLLTIVRSWALADIRERSKRVVESAENVRTEEVNVMMKSLVNSDTHSVQSKEEQMLTNQVSTYCKCYNIWIYIQSLNQCILC